MKPNKKESKEKEFIKARKRIDELYGKIFNFPFRPLERKIFVGHWRFFKVREDVLRSSIGEQIKYVVDKCNSWVLGKKNSPKSYENCYGSTYCKYFGEITVSKQLLKPLYEKEAEDWNIPNKEKILKKWFHVAEKTKSFGSKNMVKKVYYPNIPDHMLEFAYKPAYISEVQELCGEYMSELEQLKHYMKNNPESDWKYKDRFECPNKREKIAKIVEKEIDYGEL